jgi:hypothetical protein
MGIVSVVMLRLWFDRGTLLLKGEVGTPYGKWDPRIGCYRIKVCHYRDALEYLKESNLEYEDDVPKLPPLEQLKNNVKLRAYPNKALDSWCRAGSRGILVLFTAAGKNKVSKCSFTHSLLARAVRLDGVLEHPEGVWAS